MSTDQQKDTPGRKLDQLTDGSTSAATMGAGATGATRDTGARQQGGAGSAGRTDDLLAGGSDADQSDRGFREAPQSRQGSQSAAANRQSAEPGRQGRQDASQVDDDQYDQGSARP